MTTDTDVAEVLELERRLKTAESTLLPEATGDERNSRA
jgi:hypothetical protein